MMLVLEIAAGVLLACVVIARLVEREERRLRTRSFPLTWRPWEESEIGRLLDEKRKSSH